MSPLLTSNAPKHLVLVSAGVAIVLAGLLMGVMRASALGESAEVQMVNNAFVPDALQVVTGTTVTWRNVAGPSHKLREESGLFISPDVPPGSTFSFTFVAPGTYRYFDDSKNCPAPPSTAPCTHPRQFMRGTIMVVDAPKPGPQIQAPTPAGTLSAMGTRLQWTNPLFARQVHLQVIPGNNDGPGVDVLLGLATQFDVPAPPAWYGLLPGMTYRWRVRTSEQELPIDAGHPTWGPWAEATFRTPTAGSDTISVVSPDHGGGAPSLTPTLTWANSRGDVFYYELQLSRDSSFNTDAGTAIAPVYGALIHGGVSSPANSYTVPAGAPLDPGATYFWRVRPRVQGDGQPVPFSPNFSFRTP